MKKNNNKQTNKNNSGDKYTLWKECSLITSNIYIYVYVYVIARAGVIFGIYFTSCRYSGG